MEGSADSDAPGTGRSATDSAARLARLLHRDCTRLLELYVSIAYGRVIHASMTTLTRAVNHGAPRAAGMR